MFIRDSGHSWVMAFDSELEAFRAYARAYPDTCLLLVDTYDSLRQGVPLSLIHIFLGVVRQADTLEQAIACAYESMGQVHFQDMHVRRDIGVK